MRLTALSALLVASVLTALCCALVPRADAAESYDGCKGFIDALPATIGSQGVWCLRKDLATAIDTGNAIQITAHNVTIDCNGFKLGGLAAGIGTQTIGIGAQYRLNPVVRNCNIRGFRVGVILESGDGALVENNRVEGSTEMGIGISGDGVTVRGNRVTDTGGRGGEFDGSYAMYVTGRADLIDNTVDSVVEDFAFGILSAENFGGEISRNRIRGIAGFGGAYGIYSNTSGARVAIRDNCVAGPGGFGILCSNNVGTSTGNVVGGFTTEISGCTSSGDIVNNN